MKIKEEANIDFYNDFYNLLTLNEINEFYKIDEEKEYTELKPDDFFDKFYNDHPNSLKLLIYEFLIKNRILDALNNIYNKGYISEFSFSENTNKYELSYYLSKSLDEGGLINIKGSSTETAFDNAITVDDYEQIILNQIETEMNKLHLEKIN